MYVFEQCDSQGLRRSLSEGCGADPPPRARAAAWHEAEEAVLAACAAASVRPVMSSLALSTHAQDG